METIQLTITQELVIKAIEAALRYPATGRPINRERPYQSRVQS